MSSTGSKNFNDESKEALDTLMELSKLLNTGLDAKTLTACVQLCELGIHPESIATVIKEIKSKVSQTK